MMDTWEKAGSGSITAGRRPMVFVVVLVACGSVLRFYRLGSNSLWIDEYATLRISLLPFADILAENPGNNSFEPPFFFG